MTLEQLKKIAESNPTQLVTLHRMKSNPDKTDKVIWDTIQPTAETAYKNMNKSFEQKIGGWKKIYFERNNPYPNQNEFILSKNSLSNPNLIEQLKEAGFVKVEATKPEPIPVAEKSLSDFSDAELLEYLKSKGSINGKVKLKGEEEIESNLTDPQ
jgi:hypothetical protein